MSCAFHPDRPVQGVCSACGRPVCEECLVNLNGQVYCKPCLEARMRRPDRQINSFVRFVLSGFPGLGHLYMGLFQRGLQLMAGTVLGSVLLGMLFPPLVGFFIPGMIFYSLFDAREIHLRMEQGLEVEDKGLVDMTTLRLRWSDRYIAYILIGVGALALYNTLVSDLLTMLFPDRAWRMAQVVRGMTAGALSLGAGLWLLRKDAGSSNPG